MLKVNNLKLILLFFLLLLDTSVNGQGSKTPAGKGFAAGFQYNTNGISFHITSYKARTNSLFTLQMAEYFHHKELKIKNSIDGIHTSPFKYGKTHNNYFVNLLYGREKVLYSEPDNIAVREIGLQYQAGLSLNLRKKHGLYYYNPLIDSKKERIIYTPDTHDRFLSKSSIAGTQEWWRNWNHLAFNPGAAFNIRLYGEMFYIYNLTSRVYIGAGASVFINNIQHMAGIQETRFLYTGFLGFELILRSPHKAKLYDKR